MDNQIVKNEVDTFFIRIEECSTVAALIALCEEFKFDRKYPRLTFSIDIDEINRLKEDKFITEDNYLENDISDKIKDPLAKLLYAFLWKQGDLKKEKHIIEGIIGGSSERKTGKVFYHFGRHLSKRDPIIDQHVMRAFGIHNSKGDNEIDNYRKLDEIPNGSSDVEKYKEWFEGLPIFKRCKTQAEKDDVIFNIDKLLVLVGQRAKIKKKNGS